MLGALCWAHYVGRIMLGALCWAHYVGRIMLGYHFTKISFKKNCENNERKIKQRRQLGGSAARRNHVLGGTFFSVEKPFHLFYVVHNFNLNL